MNRQTLQGVHIPRKDITGWRVTFSDGREYTRDTPGPVNQVELELDSIGCLASGTIRLKRARIHDFPAYRLTADFFIISRLLGEVPVARGAIPPADEESQWEVNLTLMPLEDTTLDGYYLDATDEAVHNTLGEEEIGWQDTKRTVIEKTLKRNPTASFGSDWNGQFILASPETASPVTVTRAQFYAWKRQADVTLPYLTAARWDGGVGWKRGEYAGVKREPYAPERVASAGEVQFMETVRPSGPPIVTRKEVIVHGYRGGEQRLRSETGVPLMTETFTANQYALIQVLDLQSWYEGSALYGQESDVVTKLREDAEKALTSYQLVEGSANTELIATEFAKLQEAQNQLRLARAAREAVHSDYEPLSAKLSIGFAPSTFLNFNVTPLEYEIGPLALGSSGLESGKAPVSAVGYLSEERSAVGRTYMSAGTTMWISKVPWDDQAVSYPGYQRSELPVREDPEMIHPMASPHTIKVFEAQLSELELARYTPFQTSALTIPADYFRGPMGPALGALMDRSWREGFDPDPPPEDAVPPSRSWDGRWYFYVAVWWKVLSGGYETGRPDFDPSEVVRMQVATVTRWDYPPQFGVKVLRAPDPPEQLYWPTTWGPCYEGAIDGALLTPATVSGTEAGISPVAGVRLTFNAGDMSSQVRIGILPFRDGGGGE